MLTLYAKNEAESIPGHILKKIKEEIDGDTAAVTALLDRSITRTCSSAGRAAGVPRSRQPCAHMTL